MLAHHLAPGDAMAGLWRAVLWQETAGRAEISQREGVAIGACIPLDGGISLLVMKRGKLPPDVLKFFQEEGRKGGKIGGKIGGPAAAAAMTPAERTARAKKAAAASAKVRSKKAAKKRKA